MDTKPGRIQEMEGDRRMSLRERLTEDYYDDMQKIIRHYAKSDNIDLNTGGDDFQDIIDRLAEYEIAEVDGRLAVLPCKIGTLAYNDGWIPVEKEWPPFGQRLQATILHHEWVSDYNSAWVPEEEKIHHPAFTEVCEIYPVGELWCYNCSEDDYNGDVAYIEPAKCLSSPVAEIIAWRPLPDPYRPERSE